MMDTNIASPTMHLIGIDVHLGGNANEEIDRMTGKLHTAHGAMRGYTSGLQGMFDAVVISIGKVGAALAGLGVGGALHQLISSIHDVNNDLEKTQIAISDTFRRYGFGRDFQDAMRLSKGLMDKMFQDAAKLPGEFKDLILIFRQISTGSFPLGLNPEQTEHLAAQFMAYGASHKMNMEQVAREGLMLLQGRAGMHNILGLDLGFQGERASQLNQAQGSKRAAMITEEMAKHDEAMAAYGNAFDSLWSNIAMGWRAVKGWIGEDMFAKIKTSLGEISDWFEANKGEIRTWALQVGEWIGDAFTKGVKLLKAMWPVISETWQGLKSHFGGLWERFFPNLDHTMEVMDDLKGSAKMTSEYLSNSSLQESPFMKALSKLSDFLKNNDIWQKLENIGRLWLKVKVMDFAESMSGMVGGGVQGMMLKWGIIGQISNLTDDKSPYHQQAWDQVAESMKRLDQYSIAKERQIDLEMRQDEHFGKIMHGAGNKLLEAATSLLEWTNAIKDLITPDRDGPKGPRGSKWGTNLPGNMDYDYDWNSGLYYRDRGFNPGGVGIGLSTLHPLNLPDAGAKPTPPAAGTNIQKVEIVVNTSDEPSRVARVIHNYLADLSRTPKASPDARNVTASR